MSSCPRMTQKVTMLEGNLDVVLTPLKVWFGVVFIHSGYYKGGIFKFILTVPDTYPEVPPVVRFITDMFHPLISLSGHLNTSPQFKEWKRNKDYICHMLHYVKNLFTETVLDNLSENQCANKEAFRM
jgi:ubiquitin-protein ligase